VTGHNKKNTIATVSSQSVTREQIPEYEMHHGAKKGCKEYNGSCITTTILPLRASFFILRLV
jgi:hypothetical protein